MRQHLLKGVNGSQEPFSGGIQRSSISEHSLDGLKPPQQDANGLHMQPRSASGPSLRMLRFTARRNAVSPQMVLLAEEGLEDRLECGPKMRAPGAGSGHSAQEAGGAARLG